MSILVKGMELPKDGVYLCEIGVAGDIATITIHGEERKSFILAPVPPHGALKDADALRKSIRESIEECVKWADEVKEGEMYARVSQSIGTFVECSLRIKNAPTIIEADKEGAEE